LLERGILGRDLGLQQCRRQLDEQVAALDAIADVDIHLGDAIAADLGRDDHVLPGVDCAVQ
jgi:hypothetical protein